MKLEIQQYLQQGRYQITKPLGQGGMGMVYLATDHNLPGRSVAIKANMDTSPAMQAQFQREAVILARLMHPHLPRVTDHFVEPTGHQFLVMDYIEGDDLRRLALKENGHFNETRVLTWISHVCSALDYMHTWVDNNLGEAIPIIHRDVKPGNIKCTPTNTAVLVDFGLAKFDSDDNTVAAARAYSPGYSPIEQYSGGTDIRSDVYSTGATLYMLLTGHRPVDAPSRVSGKNLIAPRAHNEAVTQNTEAAILRSLSIHPDERFQTILEFAEALSLDIGPGPTTRGTLNDDWDDSTTALLPVGTRSIQTKSSPVSPTRRSTQKRWRLPLMLGLLLGVLGIAALLNWGDELLTQLDRLNIAGRNVPPTNVSEVLPTPSTTIISAAIAANEAQSSPTPVAKATETTAPSATEAPVPTDTHTPIPTATHTPIPTATEAPVPTDTHSPVPTDTHSPVPTATGTTVSTATFTVTATQVVESSVIPKPTSTAQIVASPTTEFGPPANPRSGEPWQEPLSEITFSFVSGGRFEMGNDDITDASPVHVVRVSDFWIAKTEVTNQQYARCINADACTSPVNERWNDPAFAQHPVANVSWEQANTFAQWMGGRLPTEAEWERAARGDEPRLYPWGNKHPDQTMLNYHFDIGDTVDVGTYAEGASPFGLLDMAGNVEEWVQDWYDQNGYTESGSDNPQGPEIGVMRVVRGGSFNSNHPDVRSTARGKAIPTSNFESVGFRVVMDVVVPYD